MAHIPTASRIFADQLFRKVRALEAQHAGHLSPGAKTWEAAIGALVERIKAVGSSIKQAAILRQAAAYLHDIKLDDRIHMTVAQKVKSRRSAALVFATFSAGRHPFQVVEEEGLSVALHVIDCRRDGRMQLVGGIPLAYVSKHAIGRLHERGCNLTASDAHGVLAGIGVLGMITHSSKKHARGELCMHAGDNLIVGSLKHGWQSDGKGDRVGCAFYDVRTVLPADEVRNQAMLEQGRIALDAVESWHHDRDPDRMDELAARIPFLPRREDDHTLRSIAAAS